MRREGSLPEVSQSAQQEQHSNKFYERKGGDNFVPIFLVRVPRGYSPVGSAY